MRFISSGFIAILFTIPLISDLMFGCALYRNHGFAKVSGLVLILVVIVSDCIIIYNMATLTNKSK